MVFSSDSGSAVNTLPDSGESATGASNEVDDDEGADDETGDDDEADRLVEYVEGRTYEGPGGRLYRYQSGEMVAIDAA